MKSLLHIFLLVSLSACAGLQSRYHRVEQGETLSEIANQYQVPLVALRSHNFRRLSEGLRPGVKLYIPFETRADWDQNDLTEPRAERAVAGRSGKADDISPSFSWPVAGWVSSSFGKRHGRPHEGVDIAAPQGRPVLAARSGHVIYASNGISGYGNLIILRHADTFSTVYAHLSRIEVKKGDFVNRGKRIGRVGKTGRATSPHLHFEVRENRRPVDPLFYLQGQYAANKITLRK